MQALHQVMQVQVLVEIQVQAVKGVLQIRVMEMAVAEARDLEETR